MDGNIGNADSSEKSVKYQNLDNVRLNGSNVMSNSSFDQGNEYYYPNVNNIPANDYCVTQAGSSEHMENSSSCTILGSYQNSMENKTKESGNTSIEEYDDEHDTNTFNRSAQYLPTTNQPNSACSTENRVILDQERFLPIANISRIMKARVDPQGKLSKEAKECVQECVSEFISFLTSEAAEYCHQTKRKTITADDLLTALEATGFDNYVDPMRIFLMKYRQAYKITGPIHITHPDYVQPEQYKNDPPIQPLFYSTDKGRRCVETQYFNMEGEVEREAPLADEFNDDGTMNPRVPANSNNNGGIGKQTSINDKKAFGHACENSAQPISEVVTTFGDDVVLEDASGMTIAAFEQQHQMQIYIDAATKQHYAAMETPNGIELYPITIQGDPFMGNNDETAANFTYIEGNSAQKIMHPNEQFYQQSSTNVPETSNAANSDSLSTNYDTHTSSIDNNNDETLPTTSSSSNKSVKDRRLRSRASKEALVQAEDTAHVGVRTRRSAHQNRDIPNQSNRRSKRS